MIHLDDIYIRSLTGSAVQKHKNHNDNSDEDKNDDYKLLHVL
jgi:hypothetical protein